MSGKIKYYRRLLALYRSFRRRDVLVAPPPLRLWVELSSRCNLRCPVCPNRDLPAADKGDMAWPLFKQVVDQGQAFGFEINLHHRGESLLHPQAGRYIRYAAAKGTFCKLHTNGTLLSGEMAEAILASGLRRLSISFDGFSAASYEKNRAGASFALVTENIAAFLERRRRLQKKTPRLAIEAMEIPQTGTGAEFAERAARQEFIRRFRELGLDEVVFKKTHNWAGHLGGARLPQEFSACTFPWNALVVFFNGDVAACAQDFFGRQRLGNAGEKSLLEIWNDLPAQQLRRAFADADIESFPACRGCDRIQRSTLAGIPREYLKRMIFKRMP
jgi:radical SAM protein with 4Fe4S-binding SPASM domain